MTIPLLNRSAVVPCEFCYELVFGSSRVVCATALVIAQLWLQIGAPRGNIATCCGTVCAPVLCASYAAPCANSARKTFVFASCTVQFASRMSANLCVQEYSVQVACEMAYASCSAQIAHCTLLCASSSAQVSLRTEPSLAQYISLGAFIIEGLTKRGGSLLSGPRSSNLGVATAPTCFLKLSKLRLCRRWICG